MKRFCAVMSVAILMIASAEADVIKPNDVRATSQFGIGLNIENLVNGDSGPAIGLTDFGLHAAGGPGSLDDTHGLTGAGAGTDTGWVHGCNDAGIAGGSPSETGTDCSALIFAADPIDDQIVEFEFDGSYDLTNMYLWNSNDAVNGLDRALDEFTLEVSPDRTGATFTQIGGTNNGTIDPNTTFGDIPAQIVPLVASGVRRVRIQIDSRHGLSADPYVGLSEVRFEGTLVELDDAADGDKDGNVGGTDFLLWQWNYGLGELDTFLNSTLTATQSEGDYDNNNVVNDDDLTSWIGEFGSAGPLSGFASLSIPEPSSMLLLGSATLGCLMARRRRRC